MKANYNIAHTLCSIWSIVIARRSYLNWKLITTWPALRQTSIIIVIARRSYLNWKLITTDDDWYRIVTNCNCEAKLLKLKANYNQFGVVESTVAIVIARRSYLNWKLITTSGVTNVWSDPIVIARRSYLNWKLITTDVVNYQGSEEL